MALFRRFFYRRPPEGLSEISERVFVFDCCFTTDVLEDEEYKVYIGGIVDQLCEYLPDASFMVFNFEEGDHQSKFADVLSKYDITLIDYPRQYENFPVLTMEIINHFLISSESWLSIGQRNLLLMHCRSDALPVLAFMLAAHLIYRKQYSGEQKTLDMIYKQATHEILQSLSPLNPLPSQLRYLQYVSRRNINSQWPPLDRALTLDCIVLRAIPNMDGEGGCRPIFRIYGQDPNLMAVDRRTNVLFSIPQKGKAFQHFKQADCEIVKIDIHCHVQGDVLLEGITLADNLEHENVMFRVMFNTAFIQSNVLILNREEIDVLWNVKDRFPKDFRTEVHFSEMNSSSSLGLDSPFIVDEGLPNKASVKVQDLFSNLDWLDPTRNLALNMLQQRTAHNILPEKMEINSSSCARKENEHNGYPQSVIDEQIERIFLQDNLDKKLESGPYQVNEEKMEIQNIQKENFASNSPCGIKEGGFCETSLAMVVETPKSEAFHNTMISALTAVSETPLAFSKSFLDKTSVTKKIESNELQVAVQRPAQCKIILPRISKNSASKPAVYSNSLQGSPVALSRYHGAPSALGITALLHDHAEFSSKESTDPLPPESAISSSVPYLLKHVQPHSSSLPSAPERPPLEKHSIKDEKTREASPPFPTPASLLPSTKSMHPPPLLLQLSAPLTASLSSEVSAPLPPLPLQSTCQLSDSKLPGILSSQPVSSSLMQPRLQSLPSISPPPQPLSRSNISAPTLPETQFSLDSKMSEHIRPQLLMPLLPPPSPSFSASTTSLSSNGNPASISSVPFPSPFSEIASTSSMGQLQVPLPPTLPPSLTKNSELHFRNPLSAPFPSLRNMPSASPPPPPPLPPFLGTAKSPSLSSVPLPPPLPSHSSTTVSPSPRILSSAPPPHPLSETASLPSLGNLSLASTIPPPPPLPSSNGSTLQNSSVILPPSVALLPVDSSSTFSQDSSLHPVKISVVPAILPTPPPPPPCSGLATVSTGRSSATPPPPPPPRSVQKEASVSSRQNILPPPAPFPNGLSRAGATSWQSHSSAGDGIPLPPFGAKGKLQSRTSARIQAQTKKTSLKPYHWLKLTRAMQGSLWAEAQKPEEASKAPELDMSELESLFSATIPNSDPGGTIGKANGRVSGLKSDKVHLIELRRAYNCEIMLIKFKVPLADLMNSVLALDDSALDIDQVDNLIKFCPTKEEIELLKNYRGNLENLGKCEQLSDLRNSLHVVNSASSEVRNSVKLKRIMQTILSLGNALNHGTARGSAIGFRLDSLLKLTETRSRNHKLTLMHYLCKVLAEKLPGVLDFQKDLVNLEAATKIQLKYLAEEMQAISKGMEKVAQELTASENDGLVSENFFMTLKNFLGFADAEVRSLASLYSEVGKNADALAFYFGEDPVRCPFEQVVSTLLNFVRMFLRAHEENCKQLEYEKKKAQKEAENEKAKLNASKKESENENMNTSSAKNI